MGPKRQPGTAANLVAGQAAGPLEKPNASQNCPRLYQGESGGLEPSTKPVAGQAAGPLEKPFASQNCPQLYQGESGGLEPSMKPMAGQAGATLHNLSP